MKLVAPECPFCLAKHRSVYMAAINQAHDVANFRFYTAIGRLILKCGDCGYEEVWADEARHGQ